MNTTQVFNFLPIDLIQECIGHYYNKENYDTVGMAKADADYFINLIHPYVENIVGYKVKPCFGNFYRHNEPYLPHTDYKNSENNYINVVVPLEYNGDIPNLIIFDQIWNYESITWCLDLPVLKFKFNTGVKGSPYEYPIDGLTNKDIDTEFYNSYLNHLNKNCLFGLSGNAYPFIPSSMIVFDSKRIHCTSKLNNFKLGLSVRYTKK